MSCNENSSQSTPQPEPSTPSFPAKSPKGKKKGPSHRPLPESEAKPEGEPPNAQLRKKKRVPTQLIFDASSPIKVNPRPQCTDPRPFSERGLVETEELSDQYDAMIALLEKEFASSFTVYFPVKNDKVIRCLFEPDFKDYRRVQKALERFDLPTELRPACRSKAELASLLKSVRQFIKKEDHFLQVQFATIDWYSSRIKIAFKPLNNGLRDQLYKKFGDTVFFGITYHGSRLLHPPRAKKRRRK